MRAVLQAVLGRSAWREIAVAQSYMREPMAIAVEVVDRIAHPPGKFRDVIGLPAPAGR